MSISKKLLSSLSKHNIQHAIIEHKKVFTAFDIAATTKTPLALVAKTLLVRAGKSLALVIASAGHMIDAQKLAKVLKVAKVSFVKEKDMVKNLKMSKRQSLSSFGSLLNDGLA